MLFYSYFCIGKQKLFITIGIDLFMTFLSLFPVFGGAKRFL